jgi:hypothetical protein
MATKYCEFEPTQHRNKRVALMVFLDDPRDPHPLAICDVCAAKLKKMRPDAIVKTRKEFEAEKKAAKKESSPKRADAAPPQEQESSAAPQEPDALDEAQSSSDSSASSPSRPAAPSSKTS